MSTVLPGVPMDLYVRDAFHANPPALSSSIAHRLLTRSALHAWTANPRLNPAWEPDDDRAFDMGTGAHAVLLEGRELFTVDFSDYRTKQAQAVRDEAKAAGKLPVLAHQAAAIECMVRAARWAIKGSPDLVGIGPLVAEQTILWQEGGTWCRCRPDWITDDRALVVSYKTTPNAEPEAFMRGPLLAHSYDLQAAFEMAGVKAATGVDAHYVYLAQETEPPYACSLIGLSPEWREFAAGKFRAAVEMWAHCLATGQWPAYSDRVCYLDLPPWMQARAMERGIVAMPGAAESVDDGRSLADQLLGGTA